MLLRIDSSSHDDTFVLTMTGEIDIDTVDLLRAAVTDAIEAGARHLTIDLNAASYLDSAGLGALVGAYKRLTAGQGSLTVRCSNQRFLRLFAITGLTEVLHIDQTQPTTETAPDRAAPRVAV